MSLYETYLNEIEERKKSNLKPKPIDNSDLIKEIILNIKDKNNKHRNDSLNFFIYNTLPGTTSAAKEKSIFLKEIILKKIIVEEIIPSFAFELLSHMKGGPSVKVLLDLAFGDNVSSALKAAEVLKTQVFLYDADTNRIKEAYEKGSKIAKDILISYSKAEFFTNLPDINEEIEVDVKGFYSSILVSQSREGTVTVPALPLVGEWVATQVGTKS